MAQQTPDDIQEYLAKIQRTVAESEAMVAAAQLRLEETDRLLEANGLTREAIAQWHPTGQQRLAANEFLRKNGLPPLEEDECATDFDAATAQIRAERSEAPLPVDDNAPKEDVAVERQRKFRNFMRDFRL